VLHSRVLFSHRGEAKQFSLLIAGFIHLPQRLQRRLLWTSPPEDRLGDAQKFPTLVKGLPVCFPATSEAAVTKLPRLNPRHLIDSNLQGKF